MRYLTTNEFAKTIKQIIDDYWKLILSKEQMFDKVTTLFADADNRGLALRGARFSTTFAKVLGKKRIAILKETLMVIDPVLYNELT